MSKDIEIVMDAPKNPDGYLKRLYQGNVKTHQKMRETMASRAGRLFAMAKEPKALGVGEPGGCDIGATLKSVMSCGFMNTPVIEYKRWTIDFPLLDADIASNFGDEIDLLQQGKTVAGVASVDTSFIGAGSTLQVDMLTTGIGVHGYAEPVLFGTIGNAIPATSASPIFSLDAFTSNDLTNGVLGPTTGVIPGLLDWGGVVQEAMWHMKEAYRVRWWYNQRFSILNESMSDVAYFASYADAQAAGTSERGLQPYVRRVNNRYASLGSTLLFQPVGARRIGSLTNGGVNVADSHVTRDFDLVDVTYGGLAFQQSDCCKPFHQLATPVLLEKGVTIGIVLEAEDAYHQAQMQRLMSISEELGGTGALISFASGISGLSGAGGANTGLELTLDAAPAAVNERYNTDRQYFKGGAGELAVLLRGWEVWGAWKAQLGMAGEKGLIAAPGVTGYMPGMQMTR